MSYKNSPDIDNYFVVWLLQLSPEDNGVKMEIRAQKMLTSKVGRDRTLNGF